MSTNRRHANLGQVVYATEVITSRPSPKRTRNIILLLTASVALMMTGLGIIMPVFARRLAEFGSGVETLGLMTMAFALAQLLASPFMGSFADRFGRRPLVLVALGSFIVVNMGYLWAPSAEAFIAIRAIGGAFSAGLFPAAIGIVADIVPEKNRGQWIGIVMGGYGAGFVFGPVIGGVLYDGWGFAAPFVASALVASLAFVAAAILLPETRPHEVRRREALRQRRAPTTPPAQEESFWAALPRPLYIFGTLLFLDFIDSFAFAFVEPQMLFYVYEELEWTTIQFGLVVGANGLAMMLGQTMLGQLSDRFGRKPIIMVGILLNSTFYIGLVFITSFQLMMLIGFIAGLGGALIAPALSAFYLDITTEQHQSRVVGIQGSALSLGGVLGPLLVVFASELTTARGVFIIAAVLMLGSVVLALTMLKQPRRIAKENDDVAWQVSNKRCIAAQASLRGIVLSASSIRQARAHA